MGVGRDENLVSGPNHSRATLPLPPVRSGGSASAGVESPVSWARAETTIGLRRRRHSHVRAVPSPIPRQRWPLRPAGGDVCPGREAGRESGPGVLPFTCQPLMCRSLSRSHPGRQSSSPAGARKLLLGERRGENPASGARATRVRAALSFHLGRRFLLPAQQGGSWARTETTIGLWPEPFACHCRSFSVRGGALPVGAGGGRRHGRGLWRPAFGPRTNGVPLPLSLPSGQLLPLRLVRRARSSKSLASTRRRAAGARPALVGRVRSWLEQGRAAA